MATDILARGIDIDDITMVVNFDVPREAEDYVHRIGRTARAGAGGKAVTLVSERDRSKFRYIEQFLGYEVRKEAVPEELGSAPDYNRPEGDRRRGGGRGDKRRQGGRDDRRRRKPADAGASKATAKPAVDAAQAPEAAGKPKRKKRRYYHHRPKREGGAQG